MKTVAIIIPTFNEEKNIELLLHDISGQSIQSQQIIIADAHSTDSTRHIAQAHGAQVVNGGLPGVGRNAGARITTVDILIFLDADVRLHDIQFLEHAMHEFVEKGYSCATADLVPMSNLRLDHFGHRVYNRLIRKWARTKPHAAGSFIMIMRNIHEQIGGFDETILLAEDQDYVERAGKCGLFGILNTIKVPVSIRRLERDGRIRIAIKYIFAGIHIRLFGPIRHRLFHYEFGHDQIKKKK